MASKMPQRCLTCKRPAVVCECSDGPRLEHGTALKRAKQRARELRGKSTMRLDQALGHITTARKLVRKLMKGPSFFGTGTDTLSLVIHGLGIARDTIGSVWDDWNDEQKTIVHQSLEEVMKAVEDQEELDIEVSKLLEDDCPIGDD